VKPVTVLMAFVLVIFLVIINRPDRPQQQQEQRRSAATTRAPRTAATTGQALPEPRAVNVGGGSSLSGPAADATAILASLVAVCLSGLAVATLANPRGR
jgi:hypothetical protein